MLSDMLDDLKENLGFLMFPWEIIDTIFGHLIYTEWQSYFSFEIPRMDLMGHELIKRQVFYFYPTNYIPADSLNVFQYLIVLFAVYSLARYATTRILDEGDPMP